MTEQEKKALEYFKALDKLTFEPYLSILLNLLDKQQKEIEVLREENFDTVYMKAVADFKDKIREKIKELNNKNINADGISAIFNITKIETLEELLEE